MTIKILACTEATFLNTGYATYFKELLIKLHSNPNYEIAEFASYASPNNPKIYEVPWKLYCNEPDPNIPNEVKQYKEIESNQFGGWKFESVACDFKPDYVLSIRDSWMDCFVDMSPFRRLFKWIWMPATDARPQNEQWVDMYARCDAVLTYNDWGGLILTEQSGGKIKWAGSAPPIPNEAYIPIDRKDIREKLGFKEETKIIGTVMRNQRRKLFPDLFTAFRKYLDVTQDNDTFLYCHTSYPDKGWDIPQLLKVNNICNKVLFTYVCEKCKQVFPSFFHDAVTFCQRCGEPAASMSNVHNGASCEVLSYIYNLFDIYVQYASSEAWGCPLTEAASCGVTICAVDYSAMSDIVEKLGGIPIKVLALEPEIETGCLRAIPDNNDFVDKLIQFELDRFNKRTTKLVAITTKTTSVGIITTRF
jgi:glycosyltransferase involved in cell wall biosynthesis